MILHHLWPILFLTAALAHADHSCSNKDWRAKLGDVRDQGDSGWCFAHTTADLVTARLGTRVSPFDIASQYILDEPQELDQIQNPKLREYLNDTPDFVKDWEYYRAQDAKDYRPKRILTKDGLFDVGGSEDVAVVTAQIKGFCADEKMPKLDDKSMAKILSDLTRKQAENARDPAFCASAGKLNLRSIRARNSKIAAKTFADWEDDQCGERIHPKKALIPEPTFAIDGAKDMKQFAAQCPPKKPCRAAAREKVFAKIDDALDKGDVASIGYASFDFTIPEKGETEATSDHASIVAARKFENGKCMYFVRNAWGTKDKCEETYRKQFVKTCEQNNGGIWVPRDQFKSLYMSVTLK